MADRRNIGLEQLFSLPWWLGAALGLLAYGILGWLLPQWLADERTREDLVEAMQIPAILAFIVGLTMSIGSLWRARRQRRKFAARNGLSEVRRWGRRDFQSKVADAFERRGYALRPQRCRGVDLVLEKDGRRYLVCCRQWKVFNVGLKPLAELHEHINAEAAAGGFYISAGVFTRHARGFAAEVNIELIGGTSLLGFLETDAEPTAPTVYREPVFASNTALTIPVCPYCGNPMVRRTAKFGKNAGEEFWGCGQYPHCRGTRS